MSAMTNDFNILSKATRDRLDRASSMLIGGQWIAASGAATIDVVDPSSRKVISTIVAGTSRDIDAAVRAAKAMLSAPEWRDCGPSERERLLNRLADLVEENSRVLAELETVDVGMPMWMSRNLNVGGTIGVIRYMAGWPTKITGQTVPVSVPIPGSKFFGYTTKEPVGVVGAIIPWNVPLMLAVWKLAPALAAGCTVVVKPSEEASLSVLMLGELALQAGFPPGVINIVTGYGKEAGEALVNHPDVAKITFTGSTATGKRIAGLVAEQTKRVTLELGGKSPQLLFADADFETAIPGIAGGIFLNSGQICVAGSRLYVERKRYDEAVTALSNHAATLSVGPGLDSATMIGPVISARHQQRVQGYINGARRDGATLLVGQEAAGDGYYVSPTIVADAQQSMQIVREEVFGPVLTVSPFDDRDEAIALANDTVYGLSACVWSRDISTVHHVVSGLKTGKVAVNSEPMPYAALPEGGVKASGYGRDLGEESLSGFLDTKSVLVRYA